MDKHKVCPRCGDDKPASEYYVSNYVYGDQLSAYCKSCNKTSRTTPEGREYKRLKAREYRRRKLEGGDAEKYREEVRKNKWAYKKGESGLAARRRYARRATRRTRIKALLKYGGTCVCCGESHVLFLTFDHINGGGRKDRSTTGGSEYPLGFYSRLLRDPVREDIRVFCYNCNCGRERNGGVCPHTGIIAEDVRAALDGVVEFPPDP